MLRFSLLKQLKRPLKAMPRRIASRRLFATSQRNQARNFLRRIGLVAGKSERFRPSRSVFRRRGLPLAETLSAAERIALADVAQAEAPGFEDRLDSEVIEAEPQLESNLELPAEQPVSANNMPEGSSATIDFDEAQKEDEILSPAAENRRATTSKRALIEERIPDGNPLPESAEMIENLLAQPRSVAPEEPGVDEGEAKPEGSERIGSEGLFAATGQNRSPAAWAAKLSQSTSAKPDVNPAQTEAAEVPPMRTTLKRQSKFFNAASVRPQSGNQKVSDAARQFLKPLMGFDPATVPVHQSPKTTGSARLQPIGSEADAVTDGNSILLGNTDADPMPEQLGLLAHELTHVARSKQPRFVPPIARSVAETPIAATARRFVSAQAPQTESGEFTPAMELLTEEELAQRVESRVIRRAAENDAVPEMLAGRHAGNEQSGEALAGETASSDEILSAEAGNVDWGGLPAPWEPLPGQPFSPSEPAQEQSNPFMFPNAAMDAGTAFSAESSGSVSNGIFSGQESGASLQRAERGREIADFPATLKTAFLPDGSTAPDLDALARQVYEILKRRLAAERRRELF